MKILLLISTILFIFSSSYAQNYEEGYFIKDGKKVVGFINYENWLRTPKSVQFKSTLDAYPDLIDSQSADEFTVHNELYLSKKIKIFVDVNNQKSINVETVPILFEGDRFLRVLLKTDIITLLEFVDSNEKVHLFLEKDNTFQELFFSEEYRYNKENILYMVSKKGYISQLRALLADCSAIQINDNLAYTKKEILKICLSYLKCKGDNSAFIVNTSKSKDEKITYSVGAVGGHFLKVNNPSNWIAGLALRINFPRNFRNTFLLVEANYNNIRESSGQFANPNYDDALQVFGANILGGMHFGKKNIRPYVNVGLSVMDKFGGDAVVGIGMSWKRAVKIEYRELTNGSLRNVAFSFMYDF